MLGLVWASVGRETNAQVRTTIVPTHVTMGVSHNVVPSTASVRLDVRLLQGDGSEAAFQGHVERMAARARRDHKSVQNWTALRGMPCASKSVRLPREWS